MLRRSGEEALSVGATAVPFTAATRAGAKKVTVNVQVAPVRIRIGTTAPTATVGDIWNVGDNFAVIGNDLHNLQAIAVGAIATLFWRAYR